MHLPDLKFRLPVPDDFEALGEAHAELSGTGPSLDACVAFCSSIRPEDYKRFGSFVRVAVSQGQVVGFVSAALYPRTAPTFLAESESLAHYYRRLMTLERLSDPEVAMLSHDQPGTLIVQDLFWKPSVVDPVFVPFGSMCFERVVRWFEGYHLGSVHFPYLEIYDVLSNTPLHDAAEATRSVRIDEGVYFRSVEAPWHYKSGFDPEWGRRLLGVPSNVRSNLSPRDKLIGRILHECAFASEEAASIIGWSWNSDPRLKRLHAKCNSLSAYRERALLVLPLLADAVELRRNRASLTHLQGLFQRHPTLLLPSVPPGKG